MSKQQNKQQLLWQALQKEELIQGDFKEPESLESPWFIKVLLAFSGWFASLFIFGFFILILQGLVDNIAACLIVGIGLIALAYNVLKNTLNAFLEHLMLSFSLAGQALTVWGLFIGNHYALVLPIWIIIFVLQSVLSVIMPHYVHRVCSAFFASVAFVICLYILGMSAIAPAILLLLIVFLVLNEWRSVKWQPTFEAISYGIILLLILLKGSYVVGLELSYWLDKIVLESIRYDYLDKVLLLFTMLYLVLTLMSRSEHHFPLKTKWVIIAATACLCLLSIKVTGITVGFALLILGFSNSNKVVQGLGIISLLFYISSYYYLLSLTLLDKAGVLLMMGVFLLAIRYVLLKWLKPMKEGANDAV